MRYIRITVDTGDGPRIDWFKLAENLPAWKIEITRQLIASTQGVLSAELVEITEGDLLSFFMIDSKQQTAVVS